MYSLLPDTSDANPSVKQQYINGHYCYAHKLGVVTNSNGIIHDIAFFDDDFKNAHPDVVTKKSDNPDLDKEITDSHSLKPVLSDFLKKSPNLSYSTFLGDAAFDSYDNYAMFKNEFALLKLPAHNPPTVNAHIHILIKISVCIPVFQETPNNGIIYINTEYILKEVSSL